MKLSEAGEARVRGYLYLLERSLRTFLPRDVVTDAVREVGSHMRDRIDQTEALPDERAALERLLAELGPPLRVAQAYSVEMTMDEAVATGRAVPMLRAICHLAVTTVGGFFAALGLFIGYVSGFAFAMIAVLKPIFPANVGFFFVNGSFRSLSPQFPLPPGAQVRGGYWVVPFALLCGLGILVGTHRGARQVLAWWRGRRPAWHLRVIEAAPTREQ